MTPAEGLRKRRSHYFVQVPSATIRDARLSYRARGVLAFLLDMPDGWDVRSEVLAAQSTEGRDAIRSALRELRTYGYYRLERRRTRAGRTVMGTAVSEEPVESWASEYAEFGERAVPVIEQPDGSFRVQRKDGSLTEDGFATGQPLTLPVEDPQDAAAPTPTSPGTGFQAPGNPAPGFPATGEPASGFPGPLSSNQRGEPEVQDSLPLPLPHDDQPAAAPADAGAGERTPSPTADLFDRFWQTYPRHVGKADARKAWDRALRQGTDPDRILAGASRFAADPNLPTGADARFVPHPATWINQGRWDDDPLPPRIGAGRPNMPTDPTVDGAEWERAMGAGR